MKLNWIKPLLAHDRASKILSFLLAGYMRLVYSTSRWQIVNSEIAERYWSEGKPFVGCFWHGRLAMMAFLWKSPQPFYMLSSEHRDGRLMALTANRFGMHTIYGSHSKKGTAALRSILRVLKEGASIGITPEGTRGPAYEATPGIIHIARLANVDVVPVSFSASRGILCKSWDRLLIPLPFSRGTFVWGKPLSSQELGDKENTEAACRLLRTRLLEAGHQADQACGRPSHEPQG
jgi:lysophospholipid acyltransferase (LPLAT)-like uncharacterized protein